MADEPDLLPIRLQPMQLNLKRESESGPLKSDANDLPDFGYSPWLVSQTSVTIESLPANHQSDTRSLSQVSTTSSGKNGQRPAARKLSRSATKVTKIQGDAGNQIRESGPYHGAAEYGTSVTIEAGKLTKDSIRHHQEMKGLEHAASIQQWSGAGQPAKAWGKLNKDPELWDDSADTLVYFAYQRPQASLRVKSSLLEATKSDFLISKLHQGRRRGKSVPNLNSRTSSVDVTPIRHEIYFPAPNDASATDLLRFHLTTRNLFALLQGKPVVGLTIFQTFIDLHERLLGYMPSNSNCAEMIIQYITQRDLHNVCNDPAQAAGLLAWSENDQIGWYDGWRECFGHCCGMYEQLQSLPEFRDISPTSQVILKSSNLGLQNRIQEAKERLSNFYFDDIYKVQPSLSSSYHVVTKRSQRFLKEHYEKKYKHWPPRALDRKRDNWLTRQVAFRLLEDFESLYNYLVDQEVVWNEKESGTPCFTRNRGGDAQMNDPQGPNLAKIFASFDKQHGYVNIENPCPLLPVSISDSNDRSRKQSIFSGRDKALIKGHSLAYSDASNARHLPVQTTNNELIKAFCHFEQSDHLGDANRRAARLARWIPIYGVLQVLSVIAIDAPGISFKDNVSYFLSGRLPQKPPWEMKIGKPL